MSDPSNYVKWRNILVAAGVFLTLLMIGISPLLNRITVIEPGPLESLLTNQPIMFDVFSKFKGSILIAVSSVEAMLLLGLIILRKLRPMDTIITALVILFMVLTGCSLLFSDFLPVAMYGTLDRYEGAFVWLGYMVSMLLAMQVVQEKPIWNHTKVVLMIVLTGQTIIGISQYFGINLLDTALFRFFSVPSDLASVYKIGGMNSGNMVYGTMNNSNFYSQAMALLLMVHFPYSCREKIPSLSDIIYLAGIYALVLAGCSGGLLAFGAGVFICSVYSDFGYQERVRQSLNLGFPIIAAVLTGWVIGRVLTSNDMIICLSILAMPLLAGYAKRAWMQTGEISKGLLGGSLLVAALLGFVIWAIVPNEEGQIVRQINSDNGQLSITLKSGRIVIVHDKSNQISISDETGRVIAGPVSEGILTLDESREVVEVKSSLNLRSIVFKNMKAQFLLSEGTFWGTDSRYQGIEIPAHIPHFGFVGKETFGSGRGFIWSRSIPMLRDTLIWGIGPDVFPYKFPQNDIVGKINMGAPNILVDKPHNWYLQVAIGTGCVSLMSLMAILLLGIQRAIHLNKTSGNSDVQKAALCMIGFITAYLVSCLFYDSIVSVSIWFWPVIGIMLGFQKSCIDRTSL